MRFTLDECQRLGLRFRARTIVPVGVLVLAPGLQVEYSMQKLIWAKTSVTGAQSAGISIARAQVDSSLNYYKDICTVAFPKGLKSIKRSDLVVLTDGIDEKWLFEKCLARRRMVGDTVSDIPLPDTVTIRLHYPV